MSEKVLLEQVREQIDYLVDAWPLLVHVGVVLSNRAKPHHGRAPSEAVLERASREAAAELAERRKPGWIRIRSHTRAPLDVSMLDLYAEVVGVSEDLAVTVTQTAGAVDLAQLASAWADPRPYLLRAREWLHAAQERDERTLPWVEYVLSSLRVKVAYALNEIVDGQVLDALCPWCSGRSYRRPTGGDYTLTVRMTKDGPHVVCLGVNCEPPLGKCGARIDGHPAWHEREWDWLAKQLDPSDRMAAVR